MLSYLPLAHSFERSWVEAASLWDGNTHIFFADSLDTFLQDLQRARPTLFISVPRLWLKFQQGVFAKMPPAKLDRLLAIPLLGRLVARKVLKGLGLDAVTQAGSGSAPIPPELIALVPAPGAQAVRGLRHDRGQFAYSHTSSEQFSAPGYVGVPMPGVQVQLSPEGEILIKSPAQFSGYYKQPELTAALLHRGWLLSHRRPRRAPRRRAAQDHRPRQGAVQDRQGQVRRAGADREPPQRAPDGGAVAGVRRGPGRQPMRWWCWPRTCARGSTEPALRAEVQREMEQLLQAVNRELSDYERLHMIVIVREPWSIENGLLTPTMKIRRSRIEAAVEPMIESWYATRRYAWSGHDVCTERLRRSAARSKHRAAAPRPCVPTPTPRRATASPRRCRPTACAACSRCAAATSRRSWSRPRRAASASSTCATRPTPCSPPTRWRG